MHQWLNHPDQTSITIAIKAVPGAKRTQIVGPLADRLKVRVAAPPEGGKANKAICELFAKTLGVRKQAVTLISGHADPHKVIRIEGVTPEQAAAIVE
jgi:hypothetical protein